MYEALRAPPWTNLWRLFVTTLLFTFVFGFVIAFATSPDDRPGWSTMLFGIALGSYVLAAVVVWSDIPWPGDPG